MPPVRQCVVQMGRAGTADDAGPMTGVAGRPFLAWLLREMCRWGIEDVVLLAESGAELPDPAWQAGLPKPLRIAVSRAPAGAGTGGELHHAAPLLHERFLLLNGASLLDTPLAAILTAPPETGVLGHVMQRAMPDGEPVDAGIAVFGRRLLAHLTPRCTLEQDVLPPLAASGQIRNVPAEGWLIDLATPAGLIRARRDLPARLRRRALFLDRDGVMNVDHGWVGTQERFEWMTGALDAIAAATRLGWHVFVVTNQSGVARGHYTEADVYALMRFASDAALAGGGAIDDWRHCPYHPDAALPEYRRVSDWRKPAPGMILDLVRAWELDAARCVLVGDQATDLTAAAAAGVPGHLFTGGNLAHVTAPLLAAPS